MTPQDLQIDWLRCFVAVVDAGSLSAAAGEVHRSQSAVSMQLKKLEDAAGRRLLERGPRKLQLTPDGQTLLGYARRMLDLQTEAQAALHGDELTGRVRLGVPDDYAAKYLTPVLKRFAPKHSGVEIELHCEQSPSLIPRVARGDLDLALVSRDHARRGAIQSLAQQGRRYKVVYNSSSLAGQIAAVDSGLAVAVLTQCSAPPHLQVLGAEQGLGPLTPMEVGVYRSRESRGNKAVDGLHDLLVKTLRQSAAG